MKERDVIRQKIKARQGIICTRRMDTRKEARKRRKHHLDNGAGEQSLERQIFFHAQPKLEDTSIPDFPRPCRKSVLSSTTDCLHPERFTNSSANNFSDVSRHPLTHFYKEILTTPLTHEHTWAHIYTRRHMQTTKIDDTSLLHAGWRHLSLYKILE